LDKALAQAQADVAALDKVFEQWLSDASRRIGGSPLAPADIESEKQKRRDALHRAEVLLAEAANKQEGIENRRWKIARYRGDDSNSTQVDKLSEPKYPAEIAFLNGRVLGSIGCGWMQGTYKISGDSLTLDVGFALGGLCGPDQSAQGGLILKAMEGGLIEKEGSNILLRDQRGRAMLLLVPF
jgi:heat shock protein HslJ